MAYSDTSEGPDTMLAMSDSTAGTTAFSEWNQDTPHTKWLETLGPSARVEVLIALLQEKWTDKTWRDLRKAGIVTVRDEALLRCGVGLLAPLWDVVREVIHCDYPIGVDGDHWIATLKKYCEENLAE